MHETRAVDPVSGHPAPQIGRAEERARVLDRMVDSRVQPSCVWLVCDCIGGDPPRISVGGLDARLVAVCVEDGDRFAGEHLGEPFGLVLGLGE